jgi:hypothetical protein
MHCAYILLSRKDLLDIQIETFYYKTKMNHDLFIVVDDRCVDVEDIKNIVSNHNNPNFIPSNVLKMSDINSRVAQILNLSDNGKETISLYKMSGDQSPFVYFEDLGYTNILMLEDDMIIVGPIAEMIETKQEFAHKSWGIITFPRIDKNPKWRGRQDPKVYEELFDIDENKWQEFKETYQKILIRAPYKLGPVCLPFLKDMYKKYLESDLIRNKWINDGYSNKSKNGMPANLFHHGSLIQQNIIYRAWQSNPKIVLGSFQRAQKVIDNKIMEGFYEKEAALSLKEYVMHVATGVSKPIVFPLIKAELDKLGYDGENSPDTPLFKTSRKLKIVNNWYIQNSNLTDEEKNAYETGTWLNPNAIFDDMMRTKSGRDKLRKQK